MKIVISLSKSKEIILEIKNDATVNELKIEFAKKCKKNIHRQSFKKVFGDKITRLEDSSKSLQSYGITDGDKLIFKDLGPQIGYRTVFLIEYAGEIFID